jgi:hypothetical protein
MAICPAPNTPSDTGRPLKRYLEADDSPRVIGTHDQSIMNSIAMISHVSVQAHAD